MRRKCPGISIADFLTLAAKWPPFPQRDPWRDRVEWFQDYARRMERTGGNVAWAQRCLSKVMRDAPKPSASVDLDR